MVRGTRVSASVRIEESEKMVQASSGRSPLLCDRRWRHHSISVAFEIGLYALNLWQFICDGKSWTYNVSSNCEMCITRPSSLKMS